MRSVVRVPAALTSWFSKQNDHVLHVFWFSSGWNVSPVHLPHSRSDLAVAVFVINSPARHVVTCAHTVSALPVPADLVYCPPPHPESVRQTLSFRNVGASAALENCPSAQTCTGWHAASVCEVRDWYVLPTAHALHVLEAASWYCPAVHIASVVVVVDVVVVVVVVNVVVVVVALQRLSSRLFTVSVPAIKV